MTADVNIPCPACSGPLILRRGWTRVWLRCRDCSATFALERFADRMDELWEEALASIPCNRL